MKWEPFVAFVEMLVSGKPDATYRSYDLLAGQKGHRDTRRRKALAYLGMHHNRHGNNWLALSVIQRKLLEPPYSIPLLQETVERYLLEFYVWHRIVSGNLHSWPKRKEL